MWADVVTKTSPRPVMSLIVLTLSAVTYTTLYRRAANAPGRRRPGVGHWLPFAAGIATMFVALVSPLAWMQSDLLWAHMLQHVLIADIAPALLLLGLRAPVLPLGLPPAALRFVASKKRAGGVLSLLKTPWVALPLWAICQWVWAYPAVFEAAATNEPLHFVEHASLFYSGLFLWWVVIDPLPSDQRRPRIGRLAILGISRVATAAICVPLTFFATSFYPHYAQVAAAHSRSGLTDQQLAGASMCFLEALVFGIAFAVVFMDVLARDEREAQRAERIAARRSGA